MPRPAPRVAPGDEGDGTFEVSRHGSILAHYRISIRKCGRLSQIAGRPRTRSDSEIFDAVLRAAAGRRAARRDARGHRGRGGLAPSTLVERFGSKRELLLAAGARGGEQRGRSVRRRRAASALAARGPVGGARPAHQRCPHASCARPPARGAATRRRRSRLPELARRHAVALRARIATLLARARQEGELLPGIDVGRLARTLHVTYNGAIVDWGIGEPALAGGRAARRARRGARTVARARTPAASSVSRWLGRRRDEHPPPDRA